MNWDTALFVVVKCKIIVYKGKEIMNWDTALFVVVKCKIIVYKGKESDLEDCYELR